jgi:hypothetical protein
MSKLNKLLNMLNELREENPDLANKALLAAETLKSGLDPEDFDDDWEDEEDIEEEEEFDDSFIVVSDADTKNFLHLRNLLDEKITGYGSYMRDHEVKKVLLLEEIEENRQNSENFFENLKEVYRLDPASRYSVQMVQLDDSPGTNIVFVKD